MLIGEFVHSFDDKNRISVPAKFRSELGKKIVVTRGLDACLFIYSGAAWKQLAGKLGSQLTIGTPESRGFSRYLFGGAAEADVDAAGRVLIPDFLRTFAHIGDTAVFVGVHDRVELWGKEAWEAYRGRMEQQGDVLAEKLSAGGFM